jgi:hypothetical protein
MTLFHKIKRWFFYRVLRQNEEETNRIPKIFNIDSAKTLGIIYDASTSESTSLVTTFANTLKNKDKKVVMLGYINDKKSESSELMKLFNKTSLNWYKIPSNKEVDDFLAKDIDVLVAVHTKESLPLQYIAAYSKAKFRIGPFIEKSKSSYDWMIHCTSDTNLDSYLKQVSFYLESIKH